MLPTVLAGERGWFPCDRCRMHAATSKQARCRFTGGEGERKEQRAKERQNNQVMSKNMQNHKNQCDSEH